MEPENIDWNNIDSTFVQDDTYEYFDAPKWFDFTASNELLVDEDDDETWFCTQDCKHRNIAQDFPKPITTTTNSKAKLLKFASFSEILPFRERNRREKSSMVKNCDENRRPICSRNLSEDIENKNPNFTATNFDGGTNKLKKPLLEETADLKECSVRSNRRSKLKSTFSAQNLLGGREIMSQITGFCSELKRLATRKGASKKGGGSDPNGVLGELKEKTVRRKERVPLLVVNEGALP
ncbi:uncharacterized protein LOC127126289 [Lathyrus oleraceus]|uniref:Uncharacterized protein n=1 Tax=Pisum sativum TaxID=3888 RepID=A0A9D4XXY8_PEA|nr:uncharacterized protein LOC127126289 [Pisum sativum]KAI5427005.1 hypothetical protein KIW84_032434 [Pisum sativum]